jgi:hypothetical protein
MVRNSRSGTGENPILSCAADLVPTRLSAAKFALRLEKFNYSTVSGVYLWVYLGQYFMPPPGYDLRRNWLRAPSSPVTGPLSYYYWQYDGCSFNPEACKLQQQSGRRARPRPTAVSSLRQLGIGCVFDIGDK